MQDLLNYVQIPANYQPPPVGQESVPLVDGDGDILVDADTGEQLFAFGNALVPPVTTAFPTVINNDEGKPLIIRKANKQRSEVANSLLGIPRQSATQLQYAIVNRYDVDPKEFSRFTTYNYFLDPAFTWQLEPTTTETGLFGVLTRHLPDQSCIQAYAYPPPTTFPWPQPGDAPSGYFPGGFTNGVMTAGFDAVRVIRYQPGKISRVTLGIKAEGSPGGIQRWGVRNQDGDGYYFELENGTDFYIVRTTPGKTIIRTPREEWNGDPLDGSQDLWVLRPDRVTMYQIEYGWYGAIGARFMALVPFGAGPESGARWIRLHSMDWLDSQSAGNPLADPDLSFRTPSLRNPFMRLFVSTEARAGVAKAQKINLYGSSAYIDGGDLGTRTPARGACENKVIDTNLRAVLGVQVPRTINGISNEKIVIPRSLFITSTTNATIQLCLQAPVEPQGPINFGYGLARRVNANLPTLQNLPAATLSPSRDRLQGNFASITLPEPNRFPMQLKLEGTGLNNIYVIDKIGNDQLVLNRALPSNTLLPATIQLNPFAGRVISNEIIPSGVTSGSVYCQRLGFARVGLWPSNGRALTAYSPAECAWGMVTNTFVSFSQGAGDSVIESGTAQFGNPGGSQANWQIQSGQLIFNGDSVAMLGYPLYLVVEFRQGASIIDAVFDYIQSGNRVTVPLTWQNIVNATVVEPIGGGGYSTVQFNPPAEPLSGLLIDTQSNQVLRSPRVLQTFFVDPNQPVMIDLSNTFEITKEFLAQSPAGHRPAFFVTASTFSGTGLISASIQCEET